MFKRKHKLLFAAALLLISAGAWLSARPAWHWMERTYCKVKARHTWQEFLESGSAGRKAGEPAFWIAIPDAGVDTLVINGTSKADLLNFPCLKTGTGALTVLAHRDIHFRHLDKLSAGSTINIDLPDGNHDTFRVCDSEILEPDRLEQRFSELAGDWLILVTCYPFRYIGPAPKRYVVWARRVSGPA